MEDIRQASEAPETSDPWQKEMSVTFDTDEMANFFDRFTPLEEIPSTD